MPSFTAQNQAFVALWELVLSRLPVSDRNGDVSVHTRETEG